MREGFWVVSFQNLALIYVLTILDSYLLQLRHTPLVKAIYLNLASCVVYGE